MSQEKKNNNYIVPDALLIQIYIEKWILYNIYQFKVRQQKSHLLLIYQRVKKKKTITKAYQTRSQGPPPAPNEDFFLEFQGYSLRKYV